VIEGHRGEERQNFLFDSEQSKVRYPSGKHNAVVSLAADVVPYPVDWEDGERFALFAGYVKGIAEMMGLKIRWGGDWNGDFYTKDTKFFDAPHFELDE
jgi:peptidoglycan L-alanyl-D-glutamate endopeptidase CwlK